MLDAADLVLVMDQVNEAEVIARFPAHAAKVRMLGGLLTTPPTSNGPDITDPFLGDEEAVRHAFAQVGLAVRALSAILSKSRAPSN
jgi:protein-tyrosine-phosphatase